MDGMATETLSRISYDRARRLLLAGGLLVLLITAAVMYVRRVDPVEVAGTLLFIPVFVCFIFWNARGGVLAAIAAVVIYTLLRYPAIEAVGADRFLGLIASRSVAFLAFGLVGGWANKQLESSLSKLELYDQIDDSTGLFNARFFVQDVELELSRADRYQSIFSVALVDIPASLLDDLGRRQREKSLKELGRLLRDSVRTVDRAVHAGHGDAHRIAVVLPETAREGANVFTTRLADKVGQYLASKRARLEGPLSHRALTFPDDQADIEALREEFASIDRTEHPEAAQEA
jgi:diguanylate cyclase (GGDEF)-like protein